VRLQSLSTPSRKEYALRKALNGKHVAANRKRREVGQLIALILGAARSGKSALAQRLACESGRDVVFIATAYAGDEEMRERIERHRALRPAGWRTVEEPIDLTAALCANASSTRFVIVDCLTLWLSNVLHAAGAGVDPSAEQVRSAREYGRAQRHRLLDSVAQVTSDLVLVSNEVGAGIIPMGAMSRAFVDEAGSLHQKVAMISDRVYWVVAGCPLLIKGG
jgi:adenosylcobinamide kinase / adenosylcobinamide-phosphate guanylyltransferase